jgi:hypothetical protein
MSDYIYRESLSESFARNYDDQFLQIIYGAVEKALAPWNPGRITIWRDDWLGIHPRDVVLGCDIQILPEVRFLAHVDPLNDPFDIADKFASEAFQFYRYRPALPIDDHIILGEQ